MPKKRGITERGRDDDQGAGSLQRSGMEHDGDGVLGRGALGSMNDDSLAEDGYQNKRQRTEDEIEPGLSVEYQIYLKQSIENAKNVSQELEILP